ncbi:MAG: hypothetical protein ACXIUP_13440, partial [Microcella sp.]
TYYLHMKPRHTAEQSTVKVNKSEAIKSGNGSGRKGFGAAGGSAAPSAEPAAAPAPARKGFGFGGASKAAE